MKIILVVGIGYVGLSLGVLLAHQNEVTIVHIVPEKVAALKRGQSPIQDVLIQQYLNEAGRRSCRPYLNAATDTATYKDADLVIAAVPTNYDPMTNFFDASAIEAVVGTVIALNTQVLIVIKSTVPVGYTAEIREKTGAKLLFGPEFLRGSKALYDNLYPSRIIVGCEMILSKKRMLLQACLKMQH